MRLRLFVYIAFLSIVVSPTIVYASNFIWSGSRVGYISTSSLPKESLSWDNLKNLDKEKLPRVNGGFLGYNFTVGDFVVGPEVIVDVVKNDDEFYFRSNLNLKLAYAFDRLAPFVTAGYSYNMQLAINFSDSIIASGYNVGAGLDLGLIFGSYLRVAYNYRFLTEGDTTKGRDTHSVILGLIF